MSCFIRVFHLLCSSEEIPDPSEEVFVAYPVRDWVFESFSLSAYVWVFLCSHIFLVESFKNAICARCLKSFSCCLLNRTIICVFCWASGLYYLRFFVIQVVSFMVPALGDSLNSYQILVYYSDSLCAIIALPYLTGRTPLNIHWYVSGLVFTFIFWYVQNIILY